MPRQRWRDDVRDQLHGMRGELGEVRDEIHGMRGDIVELGDEIRGMRKDLQREFQQNRDVLRSVKASVDHNAEMTERCSETLAVLCAESRASRTVLEDLSDDVRAQREGLLAVIDELRRRDGPPGSG